MIDSPTHSTPSEAPSLSESAVFNPNQLAIVTNAVNTAEELVSEYYKISANQWLRLRYDVKTVKHLSPEEIVQGPFAQIIRYEGRPKNRLLGSAHYDFYKICLQDHTIMSALEKNPAVQLFPFTLYILTHELIHIVRFCQYLQNFDASPEERIDEEARVHDTNYHILKSIQINGLKDVLDFYRRWRQPVEGLKTP